MNESNDRAFKTSIFQSILKNTNFYFKAKFSYGKLKFA